MVYWTAYPEHLSILWFYDCLYDHKLLPLNQYHEAICPQSWNYVFYWIYIILKSNSISQIKTCQRSFVFGFLVITHYSFLTQKFQGIISLNLCLLEIRDHQSLKLNFLYNYPNSRNRRTASPTTNSPFWRLKKRKKISFFKNTSNFYSVNSNYQCPDLIMSL